MVDVEEQAEAPAAIPVGAVVEGSARAVVATAAQP
tara:strand:+ start:95 stop:199 length:105 start_codon:yes stop_codon:yes gene_type:complete